MILVADSGSTKTDWSLLDGDQAKQRFNTEGINPYFHQDHELYEMLKDDFPNEIYQADVSHIFFYGAGCSSEERKNRVASALQNIFPKTNIQVDHDLLGSALALCGHEQGIATILGTGSNACVFDGENITKQRGGIGYILGDEGGGCYMGKKLIQYYLYGDLPLEIHQKFMQHFESDNDTIVDHVYRKPYPNRYLGAFTPFLKENLDHPFVYNLVRSSFEDFIQVHILKFEEHTELPLHSVGSVAYHFLDVLSEVAQKNKVKIGRIITKPIEGLEQFHGKMKGAN